MTKRSLAGWLADAGLRNLPLEELVDGFARQLNESGVPVARIFASTNTLHPMVVARSLIWNRATGPATHFEFQHADIDHPSIQTSPFGEMFQQGVSELRLDLRQPPSAGEAPVFAELRELGMTDWLGNTFPFGELGPSIAGPRARGGMGQLWFICSVAADRADGFEEEHLAVLRQVLPLFALAVKAVTMRAVGQGLLDVEAVLFYADLRSFTPLADTLPGRELLALLDDCFDCIARPLTRLGGEILKFMGDGMLAIFRTDDRRRAETCTAALAAASEALDLMELLATKRREAGQPTLGLDIALHVGTVQYGNVGTDTRLDFTVIGPVVNEAARIEALCGPLGRPLLLSQAFAAAASANRQHLVSLGRHRLRGVREETELFTLADTDAPAIEPNPR
jgi:adenylate cyclase